MATPRPSAGDAGRCYHHCYPRLGRSAGTQQGSLEPWPARSSATSLHAWMSSRTCCRCRRWVVSSQIPPEESTPILCYYLTAEDLCGSLSASFTYPPSKILIIKEPANV